MPCRAFLYVMRRLLRRFAPWRTVPPLGLGPRPALAASGVPRPSSACRAFRAPGRVAGATGQRCPAQGAGLFCRLPPSSPPYSGSSSGHRATASLFASDGLIVRSHWRRHRLRPCPCCRHVVAAPCKPIRRSRFACALAGLASDAYGVFHQTACPPLPPLSGGAAGSRAAASVGRGVSNGRHYVRPSRARPPRTVAPVRHSRPTDGRGSCAALRASPHRRQAAQP